MLTNAEKIVVVVVSMTDSVVTSGSEGVVGELVVLASSVTCAVL